MLSVKAKQKRKKSKSWAAAMQSRMSGRRRSSIPLKTQTARSNGYVFIVRLTDCDEWRFVQHEYRSTLIASEAIQHVYPRITDELLEFWRSVVIDDAFAWENGSQIDPKSMRLMKIETQACDCTAELFGDHSMASQAQKAAAMSKLTKDEATALGLEKQYVMMCMQRGNMAEDAARKLGEDIIERLIQPLTLTPK